MNNTINQTRFKALALNFREQLHIDRAAKDFEQAKEHGDLKKMLRFHGDEPIESDTEIRFRDDMDFFIGYYAIITAALLSGYVAAPAPADIQAEGLALLGNKYVERYYTRHYPLVLPQAFKIALLPDRAQVEHPAQQQLDQQFELLLLLLRSRMKDDDIDGFLFLLDDGAFYVTALKKWIDIDTLWKFIGDEQEMERLGEHPEKYQQVLSLISGFSKFINYLNEYAAILQRNAAHTLWHATAWELEGYWFTRLKTKSGATLKKGLEKIDKMIQAVQLLTGEEEEPELQEAWKAASGEELAQAYQSLSYLMNEEHQSLAQLLNL